MKKKENLNENKVNKKKNKIAPLIATIIVCSIALSAGIYLGYTFGSKFLVAEENYNYDPSVLEDNKTTLIKEYESSGGNYENFEPYELANIGIYKFENSINHYSECYGEVIAAGVKQTIVGTTIANGNEFFNESISASSLVQVAKRFYQDDSNVTCYTGYDIKNAREATYEDTTDKKETLSLEEHEEKWGKIFTRSIIYIISKKTVLSSSVSKENNKYIVNIELDPVKSVVRYVKQMKTMSNLERYPSFSSVSYKFTLDSNLNLIESEVTESYEVYLFGFHESNSVLKEKYYYDTKLNIPELNEKITYKGESL